jgi:hypothetical protein
LGYLFYSPPREGEGKTPASILQKELKTTKLICSVVTKVFMKAPHIFTVFDPKKTKNRTHVYTFDLSPISISLRDIDALCTVEGIIKSIETVKKINSSIEE